MIRFVRSAVALVLGYLLAAVFDLAFVYLAWARSGPRSGILLVAAAGLGLLLAGLIIGSLVAFVAGWRSIAHACAVAGLVALVSAIALARGPVTEPAWYRVLVILVMAPAIVVGARSYRNRLRRRAPQAT